MTAVDLEKVPTSSIESEIKMGSMEFEVKKETNDCFDTIIDNCCLRPCMKNKSYEKKRSCAGCISGFFIMLIVGLLVLIAIGVERNEIEEAFKIHTDIKNNNGGAETNVNHMPV